MCNGSSSIAMGYRGSSIGTMSNMGSSNSVSTVSNSYWGGSYSRSSMGNSYWDLSNSM